jgi:alpha-beta hydrolase superfamily lysophospholipase
MIDGERPPMVYYLCHLLIVGVYAACPAVVVARAVRARRRRTGRNTALVRLVRATVEGFAASMIACVVYAYAAGARPLVSQVLVTAYWATSFILVLGALDRGLWRFTQWAFALSPGRLNGRMLSARLLGALVLRLGVVVGVIIPYVLAVAMTYRPRTSPTTDPERLYQWAFEPVRFPATDGTRVTGWWIPAAGGPSARTVLLCPGATGGMAGALRLVARHPGEPGQPDQPGLRDDGYNVLAIDFRGHGDSGGQLVSYGDLERRDVLGAVRWLQATHPTEARRILGLGVSTGAAALLAAAADPSPFGQSIDAVAVYAPYDRLDHLVRTTVDAVPVAPPYGPISLPPPLGWLIEHVGLPMAGLQVGADLPAFAPVDAAAELWPRPLLVLHGMNDEVIPFRAGQAVYNAASGPKDNLFIGQCRHAQLLDSPAAERAVQTFFGVARPII